MLEALRAISIPGPSGVSPSSKANTSIDDSVSTTIPGPPTSIPTNDHVKQRHLKAPEPRENGLKKVDSREGHSTEDEMDDDAVLLKRPKAV